MRFWKTTAVLSVVAGTTVSADVLPAHPGPANNGGSAGWAMFFDLEALAQPVLVTHLTSANTGAAGAVFSVEVFTRVGTSLGGPVGSGPGSSNVGWTSLGTAPATQGATAGGVSLSIDIPDIVVPVGAVTGVAVRFNTVGPRYFGTGTPALSVFQDANVRLTTGDARSAPFTPTGSFFTSRALVGELTYLAGTGPFGACCLGAPTYSCTINSAAGCAAAGGTYAGDNVTCAQANCPPPPSGACCTDTGCSFITQVACTAAGGTYAGNNIACAAANCPAPTAYNETGDTGDLPGSAQVASGSGSLQRIRGNLGVGDADMYRINVCDAANFSASTVANTTVDTILSIFNSGGLGVAFNDDHVGGTTLQSALTNQFVGPAGNGTYYIAVSQFNKIPTGASGNIWINDGITFPYRSERAPDGPAAAEPIAGWTATTGTGGPYSITFTGTCFVGGGCFPNCDQSTGTPVLTGNDFVCFINAFANNDPYANCDQSTGTPMLTGNDFVCFINAYAQGCS